MNIKDRFIKITTVILMMMSLIFCSGCCDPTIDYSSDYQDSPFGFHPAVVARPGYANNGFIDAQNIGIRWHRPPIYAFWFLVQPDLENPAFDFSMYDSKYSIVPEGINILANIAPQGHKDEGYCLPDSYLPIDSTKYISFVKATVERYDGDGIDDMPCLINPITYWQVGNEPSATNPSGFAILQQMTYEAIKEVCPDCKVLIGGTLQPMTLAGFTTDIDEYLEWFSIFYEPILAELNGNGFDIFDFHWYGNAGGDYRGCGAVFDSLKLILVKHNFSDIPIWVTEMGSYSGDPSGNGFPNQTEAQQAGDYLKRFVYPLSIGMKKIFPAFGLIEGFKHADGYFDHTGLMYDGEFSGDPGLGVKKLGYYTYKLMTEKLEGSDWDTIETTMENGNVYSYKFTKKKTQKQVWVTWWDYWEEEGKDVKNTSVLVGDIRQAKITAAVPNAETGAELNENDYPEFFKSEFKQVVNGQLYLTLGKDPVFIEEETP